jgi:uncharacterized protein
VSISSIEAGTPLAATVVAAIQQGEVESLRRLLAENAALASARVTDPNGAGRTLLHVATDWPGHFPNGAAVVRALVEAGADVNAPFVGPHAETPLHWAASSDDIDVLDALVEAGADVEAPGSVLGGGSPMADAVGFGQWQAARRLLEHGASTTLWQAAALGLDERVEECLRGAPPPTQDEITQAFWQACHGGERRTAERLFDRGADLNWIGWNDRTPLDIATDAGNADVAAWLRSLGAKPAAELS